MPSPLFKLEPDIEWLTQYGELQFILDFVNLHEDKGHVTDASRAAWQQLTDDGVGLLKRVNESRFHGENVLIPPFGLINSPATVDASLVEAWDADWMQWLWDWRDLALEHDETRESPFVCGAIVTLMRELATASVGRAIADDALDAAETLRPPTHELAERIAEAMATLEEAIED